MKILLIQPEYKNTWAAPPLGLGYIASVLIKDGHEIYFHDFTLKPASSLAIKKIICDINPDLVGISVMVRALPQTKTLVSLIKEISAIPVVLGGPQATIEPEFTLRYTNADFAIVGEGEEAILDLIRGLKTNELNHIGGLAWFNKDREFILNPEREFIKNLDDLPIPYWDLISPLKYNLIPALTPVKSSPIAPIITTRGCPYECSFCAGPLMWKRTFRARSAKNIVDEIELLINKYKVKQIFLSDDNFTLIREHAINMCKEIIKRKINIHWACPNGIRIDKVDNELLQLMKKAGCYLVGFGIESGNQEILNEASKQMDLRRVRDVVSMAKKNKIITYGFFIIGLPGETRGSIRNTIDFAKSLPLDRAWFNILVPYPGTKVFDMYRKNKAVNDIDWENIDANTGMIASGINYTDLNGPDLVYWQRKALLEFYFSSPRRLFSVINNTSIASIKTLMKTSFFKGLFRRNECYRQA